MHERGDGLAAALDDRRRTVGLGRRQLYGSSLAVDVPRASGKPVGELERGVAERTRQRRAQIGRHLSVAQLHDQVSDRPPSEPALQQHGQDRDW